MYRYVNDACIFIIIFAVTYTYTGISEIAVTR